MELRTLKIQLQERIALGLNVGIKSLSEALSPDSIHRIDFMNFKCQFNDLNQIVQQNTLDYTQIEIGFNRIRMGLFNLIAKLSEEDLNINGKLSAPKNNTLQHRKDNFFKLLEIHFVNLEQIAINYASGQHNEKETGRQAIQSLYKESFIYHFENPRKIDGFDNSSIIGFSKFFFTQRNNVMEVYFNTIQFILKYILDEDLEKDFFLGVVNSIISSKEKACIFYYAISGLDPSFSEILVESQLLDESLKKTLLDEAHFDLLK